MRKILAFLITTALTITTASASAIDRVISDSGINKSAISISVKNIETGKTVYELNEKKPMIPASTLKVVTFTAALDELGKDYDFTTYLYKTANNELIIKLGADPMLTTRNLKDILKTAKTKNIISPKKIYIDDTIVDKTEWGEGWQWDDDLNPLMPKISAYNLDGNLLDISIEPTVMGAPATINTNVFYPTTFMNLVVGGERNSIKISRNNNIAPDVITIEGTVSNQITQQIPINHPRRYFTLRLEEAIKKEKLDYYGDFPTVKLPEKNIYLIDTVKHPIAEAIEEVMINSNNLVAETTFKLAGEHYTKTPGSAENGVAMLNNYAKTLGIEMEDVKIVDGSGVSKNNLMTANFMTSFLVAQSRKSEDYKTLFAAPNQGTLKKRMLYFNEKLRAKTGTLADVSAITGYLTTLRGKTYAFDIMINDAKSKPSDKKMLEEYILRAIYSTY